jgi:hydroxylamine reductase
MEMFCYQCEEATGGVGCTVRGVCGKSPEVAALQDLVIHLLKGMSVYATRARALGLTDTRGDELTARGLFVTITNVSFDPEQLQASGMRSASRLRRRRASR